MKKTIHLQGIGSVPAKPASEIKAGDVLVYNSGDVYRVVSVTELSPSFLLLAETRSGKTYERKIKKTKLVAYVV